MAAWGAAGPGPEPENEPENKNKHKHEFEYAYEYAYEYTSDEYADEHPRDDGLEPDRAAGQAAAREAVRTAEQIVGDAWINRLLLIEHETEATLGIRARLRDQAAERVHTVRRADDPGALLRARLGLEHADRQWGQAVAAYELAREILTDELARWSHATASRAQQAWTDRSAAGRR
ncbi:MAG: hypothetical protein HOW97_14015 [Catenulispora sp.]|nr:hypothetical protein [Catenulispora sp.]